MRSYMVQLRKVVELGGCAVLLEPEVHTLYRWLFPSHIRPQPVMRACAYTIRHPVFNGLLSHRQTNLRTSPTLTE